jgi:hypothetical protein
MRIKLDGRDKDVLVREREIEFLKGELIAKKRGGDYSDRIQAYSGKKNQTEKIQELTNELERMNVDIDAAKAVIRDLEGNEIKYEEKIRYHI